MEASDFQHRHAGRTTRVRRWRPDGGAPGTRGIVQIVHGMAEHSARYARPAEALTRAGFAVYAHDLPGHGPDTPAAQRGHFADHRGWRLACASIREVQKLAQKEQPGRPVFLLGHSLGSYLVQHYAADFGATLSGVALSATSGDFGALLPVARTLLHGEALLYGRRAPSRVGASLSFKAFNRKFRPQRTGFEWLSRDAAEVDRYVADPYCGFSCSTGLWLDFIEAARKLTATPRLRRLPRTLPVLLINGADDAATGGEQGPRALERKYRAAGLGDVSVKIYPDARHELFNEHCRDQVLHDLVAWLSQRAPAAAP
ncbi:MAG TPA: alpha/beta hydrolase [Candidatus Binatia bacterium]|nr:alpha/beta hydrolase [Candidatus Binatia bacterium]